METTGFPIWIPDLALDEDSGRPLAQMVQAEGITETLKASDQMEWVRRMNSIRNRAEEIVLNNLVYN